MSDPTTDARTWLESLPTEERDDLARRYARATFAGGAVVHKSDGTVVPIPPLLSPEALAADLRARMAADGHALVTALGRLTAWLMSPAGEAARTQLFRAFTTVEHAGLAQWQAAERLATARVDYFLDESAAPHALEVNATIPAMQGYSDIIAEEFLRAVGNQRGFSPSAIASLIDANGRNSDDLLAALLEHYGHLVGQGFRYRVSGDSAAGSGQDVARPLAIAIVHRAGDAQLGELSHYVSRWKEKGHFAHLCTPDQVRLDGEGDLRVGDVRPDLVYRHIFARRLEPSSDFARALLDPERHRIFNPLSSHLEVKGMLGFLSRAAVEPAWADTLALDNDERTAIGRSLPWTRLLVAGEAVGPDGSYTKDLVNLVANGPERFVIKRSWDYGGKSVFLGIAHDEPTARRAGEAMALPEGTSLSWPDLVRAAAVDARDAWVVQQLVRPRPRRHLLAGESGAAWHDFFVDVSLYTNLGVSARPTGGATRASSSRIVNILGGGGLAPLVRDEVLTRLFRRHGLD